MCLLFSPPRGTELFSDSIHVIPRFFGLVPRERSPRGRAAHSPHSTPRVSRVDRVVANFARARTPEGAPPNAMHATGVTAARCVAALAPRCAFSLPLRFGVTTHFLTRAMRATSRASARTRRPRRRGRLTLGAPPLLRENADARRRRAAATLAFAADLTWRVRAPTRPEATIPSKPLTNCRCSRTFRAPCHVASRCVIALAPPPLGPADARFPENPPHDTPRRFARALARLPAQPRARGGRPRHVHGCVPRPFIDRLCDLRLLFALNARFFPEAVFGDCSPVRSRAISRDFCEKIATRRVPLFSSLFAFFFFANVPKFRARRSFDRSVERDSPRERVRRARSRDVTTSR